MADERVGGGLKTIHEVAAETGLSAHALRYYERIGLIAPVTRSSRGHRRYTEDDVGWIFLLRCLRDTGMSLAMILRFAELARRGQETIPDRLELLESHRRHVTHRMRHLVESLATIEAKIAWYTARIPNRGKSSATGQQ
jgi:DNA-binding transcriptional MerR regulator